MLVLCKLNVIIDMTVRQRQIFFPSLHTISLFLHLKLFKIWTSLTNEFIWDCQRRSTKKWKLTMLYIKIAKKRRRFAAIQCSFIRMHSLLFLRNIGPIMWCNLSVCNSFFLQRSRLTWRQWTWKSWRYGIWGRSSVTGMKSVMDVSRRLNTSSALRNWSQNTWGTNYDDCTT